jgi:hypothetical protein
MLLTFERSTDDEMMEIHGDREGLLWLAERLRDLAAGAAPDHVHLMTSDWGGELSVDVQGLQNTLLRHVKVFHWTAKTSTRA